MRHHLTLAGSIALSLLVACSNQGTPTNTQNNTHAVPGPLIEEVQPPQGPAAGGSVILLRGERFAPGATVQFDKKASPEVVVADPGTLTAVTPAGKAGAVSVIVTNPDGQLTELADGFTYASATATSLTLTQAVPAQGPSTGGTLVELHGTGFASGALAFFGGRPASSVVVVSPTLLTCVIPAGLPGPVELAVTGPDGFSARLHNGFTYFDPSKATHPAPKLSAIAPVEGTVAGGDAASLTGSGFIPGMRAYLGGIPVGALDFGVNAATFTTPPGKPGNVDVAVTNPDGQGSILEAAFDYYAPTALLASISPTSGPVAGGTQVTVVGRNFTSDALLTLGGSAVTALTLVDPQTLSGTTPKGASYGYVDLQVVEPGGLIDTLHNAFYYTDADHPAPGSSTGPAPVSISRISPPTGPNTGGFTASLLGGGFQTGATVTFGSASASNVQVLGPTSIRVTVPPGTEGPATVTVTNPDHGTASLDGIFSYYDSTSQTPGPSLSGVLPAMGPTTGGTPVMLTGDGFADAAQVRFGTTASPKVQWISATELLATAPPATLPGAVPVIVSNPDGKSDSLLEGFSYYTKTDGETAPNVTSVTPQTGLVNEPAVVTVVGENFQEGAMVYAGIAPASSITVTSPTTLTATLPGQPAGKVDLTVVNPDGLFATLSQGFTYQAAPAPTVDSVSPSSGPAGATTQVTLSGQHFATGATVTAGTKPATGVEVTNATTITATLPAEPAGKVDLVVTNPDGQAGTLANGFEYVTPPPQISSIRPTTGPLAGGVTVLVLGQGFSPGATVSFGRIASPSVTFVAPTALKVLAPADVAETVDLTVTNPDGQAATLPQAFTYDPNWVALPTPSVTEVEPAHGPTTGGSAVLIKGGGFSDGMSVFFADQPATGVIEIDAATLYAVTPPNAAGPAHVTVIGQDGQTAVLAGAFTYTDPATLGPKPTLTGTSPTTGEQSAPVQVLLTGSGFASGAYVFFGGVLANNPLRLSDNIYQADALPHDPGAVDVAITNPDGQSAILKGGFTYVAAPTLASLTPSSGPTAGGTKILVTGTAFQSGAQVSIGGVAATQVNVRSPTLLDCFTPAGAAGAADVVVTNPDGQAFTLPQGFTFVPPPALSDKALLPASGPTTGGTIAMLSGQDFLAGMTATLGGKGATVQVLDPKTAVIEIPAASVGYADLTVTNPDGQTATASRAFQYKDPATLGAPPTVTQVTPGQGPVEGKTLLAVSGGGFEDGALVFFGMVPATQVLKVAPDTLTGMTPAGEPGKVQVAVTNPDGQTAVLADAFEYVADSQLSAPPTLSDLNPQQASVFGDTVIAVTGGNLTDGATFFFGGRPSASATVSGPGDASVTAPAAPAGPASVAVTNPDGQTALYKGTFTYIVPPPVPLSTSPSGGTTLGGTLLTLTGKNFQTGAVVQVGGGSCTGLTVVDSTQITCTTPPGADGPVAVEVTNPDGQKGTLGNGFTYVSPPVPSDVSPTSGPQAGGTALSITGTYFADGATVKIGANDCLNIHRVSAVLITCTTPAGSAGPAAIVVANPDGQEGTLAAGFTYLPPIPPPALTKVVPSSGSIRGGSGVTLIGNAFQVGATVKFGTIAASAVSVISGTSLTCITPAEDAGTVDVTVTNPDGQTASLPQAYTFKPDIALPPLAVTAITPNTGALVGGTALTITGNGFEAGLAVTVGANLCTSLSRLGPTALVCTTPPASSSGAVDVTVTDPDGQQVVVTKGFTYDQGGRFVVAGHNLMMEATGSKRAGVLLDVDRNNTMDFIEANWNGNNQAYLWEQINDGTGKFSLVPGNLPSEPANGRYPQMDSLYGGLRTGSVCTGSACEACAPGACTPQPLDLNQDGAPDFLYVTPWSVVVYLNDGAGKFTRSEYPICIDQWGNIRDSTSQGNAAVADFNGDGFPDVVIPRWGSAQNCWDSVTKTYSGGANEMLMLNDGKGGFISKPLAIPVVADNTTTVRAGDFDGDGDMDFITVNENNQQNRLYYNDSSVDCTPTASCANRFVDVTTSDFPVSAGAGRDAAVGDINGDGKLDIIIGFNGQRNKVYVNTGGKFTDVTLTNLLPNDVDATWATWLVDYDNDGDLDLITRRSPTTDDPQPIRIYNNDGTGHFSNDVGQSALPPVIGEGTLDDLVLGDVNRDGYPDMIWIQENHQNRILLNDTKGHFVRQTITDLPEQNVALQSAVAVDVDGDGDKDLVTCGTGPMQPQLWLNDGAGNFVDYTAQRMPQVKFNCYDVVAADVNGDGAPDLLFAVATDPGKTPSGASGASVYLFMNDGNGTFTDATFPRLPTDPTNRNVHPHVIAPIDYDGDGDLDLLVGFDACGSSNGQVRLWQNIGKNTGYFTDVTPTANIGGFRGGACCQWWQSDPISDIKVGDLDGDGKPDFFVTRQDSCWGYDPTNFTPNQIFLNNGDGSFSNVTSTKYAYPTYGTHAALADFDGDGTLDVYVVNGTDDRLYLNSGGALLSDVTPKNLPRSGNSVGVVVTDVDGNGAPDLVLAKSGGNQPQLLLNIGNGVFSDYTSTKMPWENDQTDNIAAGDFNGDGFDDLLILNSGQSRIFLRQP